MNCYHIKYAVVYNNYAVKQYIKYKEKKNVASRLPLKPLKHHPIIIIIIIIIHFIWGAPFKAPKDTLQG